MLRIQWTVRDTQPSSLAWAVPSTYGFKRFVLENKRIGCRHSSRSFPSLNPARATKTVTMTSAMFPSVDSCLQVFRRAAPALDGVSYKGQAGKIAIIGGSLEYTGAPYFAAMAAMRGGAELSFVYCAESAAPAIKAYSPDLIVYPGFHALGKDCESLDRMHAIVLGPGLGRTDDAATVVARVLGYVCEKPKPLVVDADGLWFIAKSAKLREMIRDGPRNLKVLLTPNKVEMDRLQASMHVSQAEDVVKWFKGRVVLVQKGRFDRIMAESCCVEVSNSGSLKRVGGQGDFLAGLLALCSAWMTKAAGPYDRSLLDRAIEDVAPAVCACLLTRAAAHRAFLKHGRSLLASDIFPFIGETIDDVLANDSAQRS